MPRDERVGGEERVEVAAQSLYDVPVVFCNNSNCAVLGWYGSQDTYKDVVLYSQPVGWASGGQGIIVDGRLHEGAHGLAGENKYAVHQLNFSHPLQLQRL